MQKQLIVIGNIFDCMQAKNTNISDCVELWIDLIKCSDPESCKESIQHRMSEAILPIHYLANMMSPKYKGKRLSPD